MRSGYLGPGPQKHTKLQNADLVDPRIKENSSPRSKNQLSHSKKVKINNVEGAKEQSHDAAAAVLPATKPKNRHSDITDEFDKPHRQS